MSGLGKLTDVQLLRHWKEKALVCICRDPAAMRETVARGGSHSICGGAEGVDWCGPQKTAMKALREIDLRQLPLPIGISTAAGEDNSCGRRKLSAGPCEFDELMDSYIAELEAQSGI